MVYVTIKAYVKFLDILDCTEISITFFKITFHNFHVKHLMFSDDL